MIRRKISEEKVYLIIYEENGFKHMMFATAKNEDDLKDNFADTIDVEGAKVLQYGELDCDWSGQKIEYENGRLSEMYEEANAENHSKILSNYLEESKEGIHAHIVLADFNIEFTTKLPYRWHYEDVITISEIISDHEIFDTLDSSTIHQLETEFSDMVVESITIGKNEGEISMMAILSKR